MILSNVVNVLADSPFPPTTPYTILFENDEKFFYMAPSPKFISWMTPSEKEKDRGLLSGLYYNTTPPQNIYTIDFSLKKHYYNDYFNESSILLSKDGVYLVDIPWTPQKGDEKIDGQALSFYKNGSLIKSYTVRDLIKDVSMQMFTASHVMWEAKRHFDMDKNILTITTRDNIVYSFDLTDGSIIDGSVIYPITVNLGTANPAAAVSGQIVTITAIEPPSCGGYFDKWITPDGVIFTDEKSQTTTFTMPSKPVTITANYGWTTRILKSVTVSPKTINVEKGEKQKFTANVVVEGTAPTKVHWQVSGNNSKNTKINGRTLMVAKDETAKKLTVTAKVSMAETMFGEFATATVTITSPLKIKKQPQGKTVRIKKTHILKVAATGGTGKLGYQWYSSKNKKNGWQKVNKAAKNTYKVPTSNKGVRFYYCVATDSKKKKVTTKVVKVTIKE